MACLWPLIADYCCLIVWGMMDIHWQRKKVCLSARVVFRDLDIGSEAINMEPDPVLDTASYTTLQPKTTHIENEGPSTPGSLTMWCIGNYWITGQVWCTSNATCRRKKSPPDTRVRPWAYPYSTPVQYNNN